MEYNLDKEYIDAIDALKECISKMIQNGQIKSFRSNAFVDWINTSHRITRLVGFQSQTCSIELNEDKFATQSAALSALKTIEKSMETAGNKFYAIRDMYCPGHDAARSNVHSPTKMQISSNVPEFLKAFRELQAEFTEKFTGATAFQSASGEAVGANTKETDPHQKKTGYGAGK